MSGSEVYVASSPWRWPHAEEAQIAFWDGLSDGARWDHLHLIEAIAYEGDLGGTSSFYAWDSAWALGHPVDEDDDA